MLAVAMLASAGCLEPPVTADVAPMDASTDVAPVMDASTGSAIDAADASPIPPPADLDGFVRYQMALGNLPGVAAAIVRDGEVAWTGTFGWADRAGGRSVDAHTLFPVASLSKTVTLTTVLALVEEGRLDLDAPLDGILGFAVRHPRFPSDPMSTRQLLAHVSGVVDNFLALGRVTGGTDPAVSLDAFARGYLLPGGTWFDASANFGARPGTTASYCNACLGVVGRVVERASGQDFREASRTRVFDRVGMDGAGWFYADVDTSRLAVGYSCDTRTCTALAREGYAFYPASSLRVGVAGLSRFVRMWIARGILDGVRVLREDTVNEALRIQYPDADDEQGLTWSRHAVGRRTYWGHTGTTSGGSAGLYFDPDTRRGLILLVNSDAHLRARIEMTAGRDAMRAILARMDAEFP